MFPNKEFERTKSDIPMTGDQRSVDFVSFVAMIYEENNTDSFGEKHTRRQSQNLFRRVCSMAVSFALFIDHSHKKMQIFIVFKTLTKAVFMSCKAVQIAVSLLCIWELFSSLIVIEKLRVLRTSLVLLFRVSIGLV